MTPGVNAYCGSTDILRRLRGFLREKFYQLVLRSLEAMYRDLTISQDLSATY